MLFFSRFLNLEEVLEYGESDFEESKIYQLEAAFIESIFFKNLLNLFFKTIEIIRKIIRVIKIIKIIKIRTFFS